MPILLEILAGNPRLVDGWEILSSALERVGRTDEALAALKKTVALSPPGRSNYLVDVASLALRAGHAEDARRHAELARTAATRERTWCWAPRPGEGKRAEARGGRSTEGSKRFARPLRPGSTSCGRRFSAGRRSSPRRKRRTGWSSRPTRGASTVGRLAIVAAPGATSPRPASASTRW